MQRCDAQSTERTGKSNQLGVLPSRQPHFGIVLVHVASFRSPPFGDKGFAVEDSENRQRFRFKMSLALTSIL